MVLAMREAANLKKLRTDRAWLECQWIALIRELKGPHRDHITAARIRDLDKKLTALDEAIVRMERECQKGSFGSYSA